MWVPVARLHERVDGVSPTAGALAMSFAIVAVALNLDGAAMLSAGLLAAAVLAWTALGCVFAARFVADRERWSRDADLPAALTSIAATTMLGTGITRAHWTWAGWALLGLGAALWLTLVPRVLTHLRPRTTGTDFLLTVSTAGVAVLAASLAIAGHERWLLVAATVFLVVALVLYVAVLVRFDVRELWVGAGDHWVAGGALAIATLAAATIVKGEHELGVMPGAQRAFQVAAVALWALAVAWLPVLLIAEAWRRRTRYDVRRWATVFPVGMYAAASFVVADADHAPVLRGFARAWTWLAVACLAAVALSLAWSLDHRRDRRRRRPASGPRSRDA